MIFSQAFPVEEAPKSQSEERRILKSSFLSKMFIPKFVFVLLL